MCMYMHIFILSYMYMYIFIFKFFAGCSIPGTFFPEVGSVKSIMTLHLSPFDWPSWVLFGALGSVHTAAS